MPTTTPGDPRTHRSGATPLWRQVLDDLRERLARGEFPDAFPGELDLVQRYGVSRHTIREALRELRADGIVTAERGRRPQATQLVAQPACILHSLVASARARGLEQSVVVRERRILIEPPVATRMGLAESTPLVHLELLRSIDDVPLALDRAWLPAALAEPLLEADLGRQRFYVELHEHTGIVVTGGQESVQAVIPSGAEQEILGLTTPGAAFSVHRLGTSHGMPVEWRHMLIRADRFTLTNDLGGSSTPCDTSPASRPVRVIPHLS